MMLSLTFFIIFFFEASSAINIQVVKNGTTEVAFGDILEVNIKINNLENSEVQISVKEHIQNADPVQPESFYAGKCPYKFCVEPNYYLWNVTIPPFSLYTITYRIKPLSFGNFVIPPTEVQTSSGENFYSESLNVVVHCKTNAICEPELGENYLTCPEDCSSGSTDGVCDLIKDGICDPDCIPDADPDCISTTTITEITTTTIQICNKNKKCESELGENYKTCPKDCSSGSEDGYCDGKPDGICDPDCNKEDDIDCMKTGNNLLIYGIVFGVIVVLVLVIVIKSRRPA